MSSAIRRLSSVGAALKGNLSTLSDSTSSQTSRMNSKLQVGLIGSGNWGTAIAKILGENVAQHSDIFEPKVPMWVFEEQVEFQGRKRKLSEVINETNENVKYLPGIKLPSAVVAEPDITKVGSVSDILIFVVPHQFIDSVCRQLKDSVKSPAYGISCIKGVAVSADGITLLPNLITKNLGISCGALSGANIANEVAEEKFCETTISWNPDALARSNSAVDAETIRRLFQRPYFHIGMVQDNISVCLGGALKNIVAVAAGFVDGLDWGNNSKAAVMRKGLLEMAKFADTFFPESDSSILVRESCGIGDLITSCAGGRNHRCAVEFVTTGKSMATLEGEMLSGQKLQGAATAADVHKFLERRDKVADFPLFGFVYDVVYNGADVSRIHLII